MLPACAHGTKAISETLHISTPTNQPVTRTHQGSHLGKALLLLGQQLLLLPACLNAAWLGATGRAQWHLRVFLLLKVRACFVSRCWFGVAWGGRGTELAGGGLLALRK